eukprot:scaffold17606_cov20-Tisochrysis_lutea.AAC.1
MSSLRGAQGKHIGGGRPSGRACARGRKAPCQRAYALILPPLNWHRVAARHDAFVGIMKDQCNGGNRDLTYRFDIHSLTQLASAVGVAPCSAIHYTPQPPVGTSW